MLFLVKKDFPRDIVIEALEDAISRSAKQKFGLEFDIRAKICTKEKDIIVERFRHIVEEIDPEAEFPSYFITKQDLLTLGHDLNVGENYIEELLC